MSGKIEREVRDALEATGLPWSLEPASKHTLVVLAGRTVAIMSRSGKMPKARGQRNLIATIKRAARQHLEAKEAT